MTSITKRIKAILFTAVMVLTCMPFFCTSEVNASNTDPIDISTLTTEQLTITLVGAIYDSTINGTGGWYYTYTGKALRPDLSILYKDTDGKYRELVCYEDYNVSNDDYVNNLNVGIATVTIHGIHNFTGDITRSFFIAPKSTIPTVELESYSLVYNGKSQLPKITVRDGYKVLTLGLENDYTLAITEAGRGKDVGRYAVQANLKNNYTGKNRTYYTIIPKGTYITSVGRAKKAVKVRWKKQTTKMSQTRITGYQVQVATNKRFTENTKKVSVKGYWRYYKKVSGLIGAKKYFVRVRTYKTVDGTRYYSRWSAIKAKVTKK